MERLAPWPGPPAGLLFWYLCCRTPPAPQTQRPESTDSNASSNTPSATAGDHHTFILDAISRPMAAGPLQGNPWGSQYARFSNGDKEPGISAPYFPTSGEKTGPGKR